MEARCAESCWRPSGPLLFLLLGSISSFRSWTASRRELQSACVRLERSSPRACRCGSARAPRWWSAVPYISSSSSFSSSSSGSSPPHPVPFPLSARGRPWAEGCGSAEHGSNGCSPGAWARERRGAASERWLLLILLPSSGSFSSGSSSFSTNFLSRPRTASGPRVRTARVRLGPRARISRGVAVRTWGGGARGRPGGPERAVVAGSLVCARGERVGGAGRGRGRGPLVGAALDRRR